jgi:hypothetical protein
MKQRTGSDGQPLGVKWRRARGLAAETRERPPPAAQRRGERQRRAVAVRDDDLSDPTKHRRGGAKPGAGDWVRPLNGERGEGNVSHVKTVGAEYESLLLKYR